LAFFEALMVDCWRPATPVGDYRILFERFASIDNAQAGRARLVS
jgi:hypothetical protein